ncbi:MAG: ribbon-helix-helix protein, CopG family, partial [Sulfuricella sp.]
MNAVLKIRPDLMAELDHLAVETHRSESDIINEALE